MAQPLVIAHHLIWTAYGQWLPNDPRGSGSDQITSHLIAQLGELHQGRKHIQPCGQVIRDFYDQAQSLLKHSVHRFSLAQIQCIADAFNQVIMDRKYTCYACAIMPDHVHVILRKHRDDAETMMEHLKQHSADALRQSEALPRNHPVWSGGNGWKVFLYHPDDVERTIRYMNKNPCQSRIPDQSWEFVKPYDRWPLHAGHSANSPYVKGLKAVGRYP
jgi:REP element-mobilizing transposase RayT